MEHELGGDTAVIIVSALVAILSSSTTSVSKDNIGTAECFAETKCSSVHQKLLQLLNGEMSWKENSSLLIMAISVDEAHCVLKW